MDAIRKIERIIKGKATYDGAGVRLTRIFGFSEEGILDPFLLLDYFGSDNPDDFIAGFPWHPHRGIETVTYMLEGMVEHMDSMGNKGILGRGDIQWMTAGSGIIHQEMPKADGGRMFGFQLWVNLPASHKMIKPRYQDIPSGKVPEVILDNKVKVKVLAGEFKGVRGPVEEIIAEPLYFDITVPETSEFSADVDPGHTVFAFVFDGEGYFDEKRKDPLRSGEGALLTDGSQIKIRAQAKHVRFLLIAGKPIREPVAWGGPIVMNTREELDLAFREFREGTFIK